jgi:hypothetical protein
VESEVPPRAMGVGDRRARPDRGYRLRWRGRQEAKTELGHQSPRTHRLGRRPLVRAAPGLARTNSQREEQARRPGRGLAWTSAATAGSLCYWGEMRTARTSSFETWRRTRSTSCLMRSAFSSGARERRPETGARAVCSYSAPLGRNGRTRRSRGFAPACAGDCASKRPQQFWLLAGLPASRQRLHHGRRRALARDPWVRRKPRPDCESKPAPKLARRVGPRVRMIPSLTKSRGSRTLWMLPPAEVHASLSRMNP